MVYALVCISLHILLESKMFLKDFFFKVLLYHKYMFVELQKFYKLLRMTVVTWVNVKVLIKHTETLLNKMLSRYVLG